MEEENKENCNHKYEADVDTVGLHGHIHIRKNHEVCVHCGKKSDKYYEDRGISNPAQEEQLKVCPSDPAEDNICDGCA